MNIPITSKLSLRSDRYCCWLVEKKTTEDGDNVGKEYDGNIGYYRKPLDAFIALLAHEIRESKATDLKTLIALVNEHTNFVQAYLKEIDIRERNISEKED